MRILNPCILIGALVVAMIPTTGMTAMSIAQQDYVFKMDITRDIATSTFVIGEFNRTKQLRPPAAISVTDRNKMQLALRKRATDETGDKHFDNLRTTISSVLFDFSSSTLPEEAEQKILTVLAKKADKATPLWVTGYTCDLGTQQVNDVLALKRANAVADLLKSQGFRVAAVMGKGKQGYVSRDPKMRYLNRRVEIGILTPSTTLEQ